VSDEARLRLVLYLNAAAVIGAVGLVWGAFGIQVFDREVPCPLCLLQRLGFFAIAVGGLLNLRFGVKPAHYGVTLLGALTVGIVSLRQISLHLCSGAETGICTGYGGAPMGWHLYTWAFIAAAVAILGVALLLMIPTPYVKPAKASLLTIVVFVYVGVAAVLNVGAVGVQCGLGICDDPPYQATMNDPANVVLGLTPGFFNPTWTRNGTTLRFQKGGAMRWSGSAGDGTGTASFPDPQREILSVAGTATTCSGQTGTYDVTFADSDRMLLSPIEEPCAEREQALAGSWATG
jgi:disulfide bond formation protein DsbB